MKYLFFTAAMMAILPATVALLCERAWIRWAVPMLILPLLVFNGTAINFFSEEFYRGTARGMEISIIYITAFTILLTFLILRAPVKFIPDWGSRLYVLYFLLCLPSLRNAENLLFSFFELWKMVMIYLVFLAVYHDLEYSGGDFDILLYSLSVVVVVNFSVVFIQHFRGIYQAYGVFPHQNSLAIYMLLTGLLLFARYFNGAYSMKNRFFFIAFCMASATLVRTYSRGALVCYPFGGLVTLLCSIRYNFTFRKIYIFIIIFLIGLAGLFAFLPRVIERFEKAPASSGETRKNLAIAAVNMMRDKPLWGVGINNWGIKINPPYNYSRHRENKHYRDDYKDGIVETIYLLVGAECGIPCLFLLLLWFVFYWISAIRLLYPLRRTQVFYIPAGALGGMTGIFLQSALEWVLKQQINFMLLVIVFACISYLNGHYREFISDGRPAAAPSLERS